LANWPFCTGLGTGSGPEHFECIAGKRKRNAHYHTPPANSSGPSLEATSNAASPTPNPMSSALVPAPHRFLRPRRPRRLRRPLEAAVKSHPPPKQPSSSISEAIRKNRRGVLPPLLASFLRNYPARRDLPVRTKTSRCAGSLVTGGLGPPEPAPSPPLLLRFLPSRFRSLPNLYPDTGTGKKQTSSDLGTLIVVTGPRQGKSVFSTANRRRNSRRMGNCAYRESRAQRLRSSGVIQKRVSGCTGTKKFGIRKLSKASSSSICSPLPPFGPH